MAEMDVDAYRRFRARGWSEADSMDAATTPYPARHANREVMDDIEAKLRQIQWMLSILLVMMVALLIQSFRNPELFGR